MRQLTLLVVQTLIILVRSVNAEQTDLFNWEKIQLSSHSSKSNIQSKRKCKSFPGDADWPNDNTWRSFNNTLHGALLKPAPLASVCYDNTTYNNYSPSQCDAISSVWATGYERAVHPIEVNSLMFEGMTCIPPSNFDTHGCTQGGYPAYVVNISTVAHIQAAVNFARERNVRLVVKNTGHDFSGKSLGGGSLSVWTHDLKDIKYYPNYKTQGYSGPAFKVGAGIQGRDIYAAALEKGLRMVGGICDSVGLYGGYSQGGGHSMISSLHGMGADQVLSIQLVTASGEFITASPTSNTDLFWAMRGGGGSVFGIVTSMIVKAHPDAQTTFGTLEWSVAGNNISQDTFWDGVRSYFSYFANFTSYGTSAQWNLYPSAIPYAPSDNQPRFVLDPFIAPGKSQEESQAIVAPWLTDMATLGIDLSMNWTQYSSYATGFHASIAPTADAFMPYTINYASRLIPRENFDASKKLNETVAAYRSTAEAGHTFLAYTISPTLSAGKPVGKEGNAILPAWRNALSHTIIFNSWSPNATAAEQLANRKAFANEGMKALRDATPGSGSYMNEADVLEPNLQQAFYGGNYERLLEVKRRRDPGDVFWAVTGVGSEAWEVKTADGLPTQDGRLCRVDA